MSEEKGDRRAEPFDIDQTLDALRDEEGMVVLPAGAIYGLSDLKDKHLNQLHDCWHSLSVERRRSLVEFLAEIGEVDFALSLEPIAYVMFEDSDPAVRAKAIELTWYETSEKLFNALMRLADDEVPLVRAAALSALGRFIYEAELEEFDEELATQAHDLTISRYHDLSEDLEVRRRALEAISNSSHPQLSGMIEEAYNSDEIMMQVSAVFAMGASCDDRWHREVLAELDNENAEIRYEAARAAGALELDRAVPTLIELAHGEDYEVQMMAIAALGEIGTKEAQRGLEALAALAEEVGDAEMADAVDEAIEIATLVSGVILPMFDFEEDDIDEGVDPYPPLD